jgi:hypothetical protein
MQGPGARDATPPCALEPVEFVQGAVELALEGSLVSKEAIQCRVARNLLGHQPKTHAFRFSLLVHFPASLRLPEHSPSCTGLLLDDRDQGFAEPFCDPSPRESMAL